MTVDGLAGCVGKVRLKSAASGHKVNKKRSKYGKACEVYRCSICNGWHLGRRTKRGGKPRED